MGAKLTIWFLSFVLIPLSTCDVPIPANAYPVYKDVEPTDPPTTMTPTTPTTTSTDSKTQGCTCKPVNTAATTHKVFQKKQLILMSLMVAVYII